jgi:hypothetical protein
LATHHGLQGPQTARETSFIQAFGRELHEAREATRRYQKYGEIKDLDNAWDIYFAVRKIVIHRHDYQYSRFSKGLQESRETTTATDHARLAVCFT